MLRLLETQEEQDRWRSDGREAIQSKLRLGLDQLQVGEGIPEDHRRRVTSSRSGGTSGSNQARKMPDHVESTIKKKFIFPSGNTGAGHIRSNLTAEAVKFFPAYSYLIVYRSETNPLQVVSVLHRSRDVERILKNRW